MREPSGHVQLSEVSSHPRSLNETILVLNQLADNDHPYNSKHAYHGNLHSGTLHLCSASCYIGLGVGPAWCGIKKVPVTQSTVRVGSAVSTV